MYFKYYMYMFEKIKATLSLMDMLHIIAYHDLIKFDYSKIVYNTLLSNENILSEIKEDQKKGFDININWSTYVTLSDKVFIIDKLLQNNIINIHMIYEIIVDDNNESDHKITPIYSLVKFLPMLSKYFAKTMPNDMYKGHDNHIIKKLTRCFNQIVTMQYGICNDVFQIIMDYVI